MKGLVIFNGIHFPYHMADYAFAWAKEHQASLHGIFMHASEPGKIGYPFPNDLDLAENITDDRDAEEDNMKIIADNEKLFQNMGKIKDTPIETAVMLEPSLDEILHLAASSSQVFVDGESRRHNLYAARKFNIKELIERSPAAVEQVYDKKVD